MKQGFDHVSSQAQPEGVSHSSLQPFACVGMSCCVREMLGQQEVLFTDEKAGFKRVAPQAQCRGHLAFFLAAVCMSKHVMFWRIERAALRKHVWRGQRSNVFFRCDCEMDTHLDTLTADE